MNATAHFPRTLHWSAEQLANAIPMRLHQVISLELLQQQPAANDAIGNKRRPPRSYLPTSTLPARFNVR